MLNHHLEYDMQHLMCTGLAYQHFFAHLMESVPAFFLLQ